MHIYRARGAVIEWERTAPAAEPSPSPAGPAMWRTVSRTGQRALHWFARPDGAAPAPSPAPAPAAGGGWARAAPRKKTRHDYLSPPTREQMAERVRKQREALGILPKPAQKRIEAAVKKAVRKPEPSLAPLAPVAAEVAQDTGTPLQAVIDAISAAYATQRGLIAARMEADAARRREEEARAIEQARVEAEAAQRAWRQRLPQLLAADEELLRQGEEARQQAIQTIRSVQKALLALIQQ